MMAMGSGGAGNIIGFTDMGDHLFASHGKIPYFYRRPTALPNGSEWQKATRSCRSRNAPSSTTVHPPASAAIERVCQIFFVALIMPYQTELRLHVGSGVWLC